MNDLVRSDDKSGDALRFFLRDDPDPTGQPEPPVWGAAFR